MLLMFVDGLGDFIHVPLQEHRVSCIRRVGREWHFVHNSFHCCPGWWTPVVALACTSL